MNRGLAFTGNRKRQVPVKDGFEVLKEMQEEWDGLLGKKEEESC